jgi:antitoxin component of MazEF toxin-antitoxin module
MNMKKHYNLYKVQRQNESLVLTIPEEIAYNLDIKPKDDFFFDIDETTDNKVVLRYTKLIAKE